MVQLISVILVRRLRAAKVFCFDVDSTVITSEGIDELAATCGVKEEVEKLTAQAMGGGLPFHESLRARLDIMRPTKQQVSVSQTRVHVPKLVHTPSIHLPLYQHPSPVHNEVMRMAPTASTFVLKRWAVPEADVKKLWKRRQDH